MQISHEAPYTVLYTAGALTNNHTDASNAKIVRVKDDTNSFTVTSSYQIMCLKRASCVY